MSKAPEVPPRPIEELTDKIALLEAELKLAEHRVQVAGQLAHLVGFVGLVWNDHNFQHDPEYYCREALKKMDLDTLEKFNGWLADKFEGNAITMRSIDEWIAVFDAQPKPHDPVTEVSTFRLGQVLRLIGELNTNIEQLKPVKKPDSNELPASKKD